jgi:hypothetical protein
LLALPVETALVVDAIALAQSALTSGAGNAGDWVYG